jgi:hypothetical protein
MRQPNPACAAETSPKTSRNSSAPKFALHDRIRLDDSNFLPGLVLEGKLLPRVAAAFSNVNHCGERDIHQLLHRNVGEVLPEDADLVGHDGQPV